MLALFFSCDVIRSHINRKKMQSENNKSQEIELFRPKWHFIKSIKVMWHLVDIAFPFTWRCCVCIGFSYLFCFLVVYSLFVNKKCLIMALYSNGVEYSNQIASTLLIRRSYYGTRSSLPHAAPTHCTYSHFTSPETHKRHLLCVICNRTRYMYICRGILEI